MDFAGASLVFAHVQFYGLMNMASPKESIR